MRRGDIASLEYAAQIADERARDTRGTASRLLAYVTPFRGKLGLVLLTILLGAASQARHVGLLSGLCP